MNPVPAARATGGRSHFFQRQRRANPPRWVVMASWERAGLPADGRRLAGAFEAGQAANSAWEADIHLRGGLCPACRGIVLGNWALHGQTDLATEILRRELFFQAADSPSAGKSPPSTGQILRWP